MYYYAIIALQGFCVYHCYTNRNNYYWIFAIIFLPVIGCILYLFTNVFQKRDIEKVQESLVTAINPSKKITDLEKKLKFSETFENRVALADAYLEEGLYPEAISHYESSLKDVFSKDFYVISKLLEAHYHNSNPEEVVVCAEKILDNPKFRKSKASFLYALTLEKMGKMQAAEEVMRTFDAPYSNFSERLELARFLQRQGKLEDAKELYQEMVSEFENMSKPNFRQNRHLIKIIREELQALQ
ncbi:PLDc N-terminal domain-containing protein [Flagellimonas sp.]|uniref:PLDc N-terminal domain-containing protein n=1 Tax=Flagellimonas sp. TaxID=2058762 RepID=UPI003BAE5346